MPYRVVFPDVGLEEDAHVPDDPAHVVEGEGDEQILMHLDSTAVQTPGRGEEE